MAIALRPAPLGRIVAEVLHEEPVGVLEIELSRDAPFGRLDVAVPGRDRLGLQLRGRGAGRSAGQERGDQRGASGQIRGGGSPLTPHRLQ